MMKERPIIFNQGMVRAILAGRKTQTRRVMKPQPEMLGNRVMGHPLPVGGNTWVALVGDEWGDIRCPYGKPGDRLWVRETWGLTPEMDSQLKEDGLTPGDIDYEDALHIGYRADGSGAHAVKRWRPSIHMPRWASRITLEVTGVQVQRVREIGEADAIAEGIDQFSYGKMGINYAIGRHTTRDPVVAFALLWDSINAKRGYAWESNPFVWVVEFSVLTPAGKRQP